LPECCIGDGPLGPVLTIFVAVFGVLAVIGVVPATCALVFSFGIACVGVHLPSALAFSEHSADATLAQNTQLVHAKIIPVRKMKLGVADNTRRIDFLFM
jgi:hypothetical protein